MKVTGLLGQSCAFAATADVAAELVSKEKDGAPICVAVNELRARFYDKEQDGVRTEGLKKIWQTLWPLEDELVERTAAKLATLRETGVDPKSMRAIHVSAAEQVLANVQGLLKAVVTLQPVAPAATQ